jgi:integrase/recombinase XerD
MNFYLSSEVLDLESKHTQRAKKLDLDKFLFFFDRTFPGRDVRMWDIVTTASFLRALREEYASASVYRTFATLTNFAQFLIDHEVFPPVKHPTRGVGKNVLPKRELQPADGVRAEIRTSGGYSKEYFASSDEMFDTYLQAGEKAFLTGSSRRSLPYRDIAIVSMLYHSGLRVTELCSLKVSQIHPGQKRGGVWFYKVPCKGNRERNVYVPEEAYKLLVEYLDHERETILLAAQKRKGNKNKEGKTESFKPSPFVFLSAMGKRLTQSTVWNIVQKFNRAAERHILTTTGQKVKLSAHPHSFRHERGFKLRELGLGDSVVANGLGHADTSQVARYSRHSEGDQEEVLERASKRSSTER